MAVGLLVLAAEGFLQIREIDRTVGQRHAELVSLPLVVQRRRAPNARLLLSESLAGKLLECFLG